MKKIKEVWSSLDSLDDRIFILTVTVSIFVCVITLAAGVLQGLPWEAQLATFGIFCFMIILLFLGIRFPSRRTLLRFCLVAGANFIFFPISFFASGGIHSGMILFFLVGLFLVAVMLRGNAGGIVFLLSLIGMILSVEFAQHFPDIVAPMSMEQHYQDVKITLIISGFGLYTITMLILMAYNRERQRNAELMETLRNLSVRDALSGLYNRRELFRRLEIMYHGSGKQERKNTLIRENHYIAMFDIDDFKALNDTYGHGFGDQVLSEVAHVLQDMVSAEKGEVAARYGGEEFVCVLIAGSMEEAYSRVEEARKQVSALSWEGRPSLQVHISGGIVSCMDGTDLTSTMREVDALLYQAKGSGKNRICMHPEVGGASCGKKVE